MTFRYNTSGRDRKKLATAVGEILNQPVVYNGAPSYAYAVGGCMVDRSGSLICPPETTRENVERIICELATRGFETADAIPDDSDKLTIEIPYSELSLGAIENIKSIIASKETLFKKAFQADSLPIEVTETEVKFPWFTLTGADGEADAYGRFVSAICEMAKRQRRVTAKEKESQNDKFDMRVFLIRLGFVGDEYKQARKILMRNLTGNSAFKRVE